MAEYRDDLHRVLADAEPGTVLPLTLLRHGQEVSANVVVDAIS